MNNALPPRKIRENMKAAAAAGDWNGILKWEGRMEELLQNQSAATSNTILDMFQQAHLMYWLDCKDAAGEEHGHQYVQLEERRIDVLGKMGSVRESAIALCDLSDNLLLIEADGEKAARFLTRAREIGAAHGFVEAESRSFSSSLLSLQVLEGS